MLFLFISPNTIDKASGVDGLSGLGALGHRSPSILAVVEENRCSLEVNLGTEVPNPETLRIHNRLLSLNPERRLPKYT